VNTPSTLKTFFLRILSLLFVLLCGLFATFMLYFLVVLIQNGFNLEVISTSMSSMMSDPMQIRIVQTLQSFCIFILPPFVLCGIYGVPTGRFLSLKLPNWKPALMGMLSIVVLMPLLNAVVAWNAGLHLPDALHGVESWMRASENAAKVITDRLLAGTSALDLTLNLIIVAVLAGVGEELFFRGLLMRIVTDVLKTKPGSTQKPWVMHVSIWTIAILFSAIHIQFFGFFPRMIIGAWFGYLLWWTGSIWVPILAHFLNNALSTLTVFGQNKGMLTDNPDRWGLDQTWWLSLISLVLVAGTVRYFVKLKKPMITLHNAETSDIPMIRDLAGRTWFETYREILSQDQMDYMFDMMYSEKSLLSQMTEKKHEFFIAYESETPLGFVSVEKQNGSLFHLHKLYIVPHLQKKGVGRILMEKAYEYAREHADTPRCIVELNMNRDNPALHFYEKMGMKIHDRGDFHIGNGYYMNDYILRIELD